MYQEDIARATADHLRTHIKAYLDAINADYVGTDKITLTLPKSIIVSSQVGGLAEKANEILPMYGIDVLSKAYSGESEDLWLYDYVGQINGLVSAQSQVTVDTLVKRHARSVEKFIRDHRTLHNHEGTGFSIVKIVWAGLETSGAERIELGDRELWIAGFSHDLVWVVSEDGEDQHG